MIFDLHSQAGFPLGGVRGGGGVWTPHSAQQGGNPSPPPPVKREKKNPYFGFLVKIGHLKHSGKKNPGGEPTDPPPFVPPLSNIPGGNPDRAKNRIEPVQLFVTGCKVMCRLPLDTKIHSVVFIWDNRFWMSVR